MLKVVEFRHEDEYVSDFLELPKKLYSKQTITQNEDEERSILCGIHTLSKYFTVHKFLVYDNDDAIGRFIVTLYENDSNAYIGYFECVNSREAAKLVFDSAKQFAAKSGKKRLIGPYDASFWIKYRLKTNNFKSPYTGEPYNNDYYYKLFLDNGFTVLKRYVSNQYPHMPQPGSFRDEFVERYNEFIKNGYVFKSPTAKTIDNMMSQSYKMIVELYSDFPGYKYITEKEFNTLYSHLKYISDKKMIKMAYYNDEPVGFLISFPDYSNRLYKPKLEIEDYIEILTKHVRNNNYIWLYIGVKPEHRGLGKALCNSVLNEQFKKNASFMTALIKDDNVNSKYMKDIIESVSEYVLLECKI